MKNKQGKEGPSKRGTTEFAETEGKIANKVEKEKARKHWAGVLAGIPAQYIISEHSKQADHARKRARGTVADMCVYNILAHISSVSTGQS